AVGKTDSTLTAHNACRQFRRPQFSLCFPVPTQESTMSELALREDRDGVAIVTLNRPDKLNAINREMQHVIWKAVDDLRERSDLRVLLIRAKGRFFTAGADVAEPS